MAPDDNRLERVCGGVGETARGILDWIGDSGELMAAERVALLHEVYRTETAAHMLGRAMREGPCAAFVGPSRAGKTQLVAAIVDRTGGTPSIRFDGIREHVSFLKHISPDGGRFGASAVMRLTGRGGTGAQNFPVAVRILSIADVVKVLGAAFISGAERGDLEPSMASIDRIVAEARERRLPEAISGLSEEEIWDIRHYFTTRFGEEPLVRTLLTGGYWETLTDLVGHLPNAERGLLFSVLWGGLRPITDVFVALADAIASLGCGREARCALDAVLGLDSRTGRFQRRPDNVISAQTLSGLGRPDDQTVVVASQFGQWVSVQRSLLAAIIAEVRLPVAGATSELLDKADLLEFPSIDAASSAGNLVRGLRKDPAALGALYMRAKAIYLLERYIEEQSITSMVVCLEATASKVGDLANLVASWVEKSHGGDPAAREAQANGLFLAFTKIDRDFAEPARRAKERRPDWGQRIAAVLRDGFGRHHAWPTAWTTSRAFDNVHLLRSPFVRTKHLLAYGNDGRELGLKPELRDRIERFRRDFLACDVVGAHVADPPAVWDDLLALNDGGTTLLAQSIADVCGERVKHRHVLNDLGSIGRSLRDRLQRYHVAEDQALQRDRRHIAALMVTRRLRRCAEERRLGHLIRALQLTDAEFTDVLQRHETTDRPVKNGVNGNAHAKLNGHGHHAEPAAQPITVEGIAAQVTTGASDVDALARRYAQLLMTHWVASARLFAQAERICQTLQMPRTSLLQLVDELIAGATRLAIEERIAQQIEAVMADAPEPRHHVARAAMCAANIISDYVMWLGFNDTLSNAHPRRRGRAQTPIFPPRKAADIWSEAAATDDFDREFLADWSQAFLALVGENADELGARDIEGERNRRLGDLLARLNVSL